MFKKKIIHKNGSRRIWANRIHCDSTKTRFVWRRSTRKLTVADGQVKFRRRDRKGKNVTNWGTKGCCWRSTCWFEQPPNVPAPRPIARPRFYPTSSLTHAPNAISVYIYLTVALQNAQRTIYNAYKFLKCLFFESMLHYANIIGSTFREIWVFLYNW